MILVFPEVFVGVKVEMYGTLGSGICICGGVVCIC